MIPSMHLTCQIDQLENIYRTIYWKRTAFSLKDIFSRNVLSIKFQTIILANMKVFQPKANRPSPYIVGVGVGVWGTGRCQWSLYGEGDTKRTS